MDATERMIESIQERKKITDERIKNLHEAVKEKQANRRTQTEQQSRPD